MGDTVSAIAWAWLILVIFVGATVGHRYGRLASFAVMIELMQITLFIMALSRTGRIEPMALVPGVGILPGIGRYSGISAGGLIFPLIFILVAMFSKKRQPTQQG